MLAIDGLGLGGAEMVVRDLARGLDARSFDVSICCTKGLGGSVGETLLRDGYDVFVLPGQTDHKVDYLTALKFRRAIVDRKIDVVHTHATPALLDAAPCRVADRRLRLVHTFHFGNYPYDHWRHHLLELICARGVDRLIAVGWDQQRRISTAYHLPSSRVAVIWNGITVGNAAADTSFRAAIGTGERLLVGTVAKLIEQKGLDLPGRP